MFNLNREHVNQRDLVLFGEPYNKSKYMGGCRRFEYADADDLQELFNLNVISEEDQQNEAPTAGAILEFLKKHRNFWAHGYAISPERGDYRVSLEGVECGEDYDLSDIQDFFSLFKYPDELQVEASGVYCWYD